MGCALKATDAGARVTLIRRGTPLGTCVNIGCVPFLNHDSGGFDIRTTFAGKAVLTARAPRRRW